MNPNVATIDERAQKYLGKAHEAIGHLGELFRDLLSVTKAEENQLADTVEAVNLAKLLQTTIDDMQLLAQKKNLTLVYQIGDQAGKAISPLYYVAASPERLREVVMNLIDNGIKFTTQGGIKVTLEGNDKECTVSVSDTGLGIAQEDIPHLFQKFYRIDSSDTRTIGGTGLGLYLCRRVIELFNGRIWIESKVGQGSAFKFLLPRLSQTEVSRMQAETTQATAGSGAVVQPGKTPSAAPTPDPMPTPAPAPSPVVPPAGSAPAIATAVPGQEGAFAAPGERPVPITLRRRVQ
jgi:signal transduction histidine kinase